MKAQLKISVLIMSVTAAAVIASVLGLNASHDSRVRDPLKLAVPITDTTFTVRNLGYVYDQFSVPAEAKNISVNGHFVANGGTGNDIEVYVLNADGFANFRNGHDATTLYSSGRLTQNSMRISLPSGEATYYLVFNNKYSLLSSKTVQAHVMLTYLR
jgi:hypothetical protein